MIYRTQHEKRKAVAAFEHDGSYGTFDELDYIFKTGIYRILIYSIFILWDYQLVTDWKGCTG